LKLRREVQSRAPLMTWTTPAEARERGVSRAVEILSGQEMLSAANFAEFIDGSREAVRAMHQRNEVLGLKGANGGLRYPKWQVGSESGPLPELPRLFALLSRS
jgi:hypothetical protein